MRRDILLESTTRVRGTGPACGRPGLPPTRAEFLTGAAALLLLGGGGAGGGDGGSGGRRTVKYKYGKTEVSGNPDRVVSVGFTDHDYLLTLGATPAAVREWYGEDGFVADVVFVGPRFLAQPDDPEADYTDAVAVTEEDVLGVGIRITCPRKTDEERPSKLAEEDSGVHEGEGA